MARNERVSRIILEWQTRNADKVRKTIADIRKEADAAYQGRVDQLATEKKQTVSSLADIRKSADAAYSARVSQLSRENELQTQQVSAARAAFTSQQAQVPLAQRLADAEAVRANAARQGLTAQQQMLDTLRSQSGFVSTTGGAGGGGVSTIGGRISGASRALFNLPDVQLGGGVSTTFLSRLGLLAGGAVDALGLTAAGIAGIGLVTGGVVLALKAVTDAEAARGEAAKKTADQIRDIAERGAGGSTTEEIQGDNARLNRTLSGLEEGRQTILGYQAALGAINTAYGEGRVTADAYRQLLTDVNAQIFDATGGLLGMKDGVGQAVSAVGDFNGILDANKEDIREVTAEIAANNVALETSAVKNNDAAAALERLTEAQLDAADRALELDRLTKDQREERIRQNERDVNVLTRLVGEGELTSAALAEVALRIGELNTETEQLRNTSSSYADELEREQAAKEALTERNQQILDLATQQVEAYEEIFAINQRISDIIADAGARIDEITADRDERLLELEEDAADQREKIISDSNDRIAKILRDSGHSINEAIARRDVLNFTLAAERREDALDDEQDALEKSLENVEANLDKQEKAIDKSYRKQVDSVSSNSQRQVEILQRGLREQEHIISTSQTSQVFLSQSGAIKVISEHAKMYTALEGEAYIAGTKLPNAFRTGIEVGLGQSPIGGRLPIGGGDGGLGIGQLGAFRGAVPPLTPQVNRSSVGIINIPVTVNGASEDVVIERVRTAYRKAMQQMNNG